MINPFQTSNMPNVENFQDPLGFVKKLWGDMKIPGMVTPTVSVDELDQQIKDLKAVESWLSLNMNMLRSSIHALEVQRSTIAALKTMGESFTKQQASFVKAQEEKLEEIAPSANYKNAPEDEQEAKEAQASQAAQAWAMPTETNAWWNVVQDQFKQALNQVMVSEESASNKTKTTTNTTTNIKKPSASAKTLKPTVKTKPKTNTAASTRRKAAVKKTSS
jgi:hypothetical protein